ncbi:hypothetical protein HNV11_15030 [Spirosoma taeanense]|uniref:Uncharacterized protein n=1 Tax=Spirosoma taeanense TaxID=2735870 RepID=A0A6M5YCG6_9BACT|nr:hypothetical protein [Spirosoma taeanense]QJW90602.1 hypothetical protein HNV11_15030 [Spirosoma taeanense]
MRGQLSNMKANRLPSGFRYLLSKRDIRALQQEIGVKFLGIGFGYPLDTERLDADSSPITKHPISLSGRYVEDGWKFSVYQSGFRDELIPAAVEAEAKNGVRQAI